MRDGWVETPIGDVAQVLSGFAFKSELFNKSEGIPLIRIRDLPKRDSTEALYSGSYEDRYVVKKGDFLIGMDGEFHCYEWNGPHALLNQRVCRIQGFKIDRVVPRYIYFVVNQYLDKIEQDTGYTTVKHISAKQVLGITIPLPPLSEQKRIVDLISSVDSYIEALQQQLESSKRSRNAVLHELLTAGGDGWITSKLGQYIDINTGKLDVNAASEFGDYPFFTCSRETYRIDEAAFEGESVLVAGNGDLNVKFYDGKFNAYQRTYVLNSVDKKTLDNRFLFLFMQTYIEYLRSETRGTVIQYLKKGQFTDAKINLPPLPEQKRIVEIVKTIDEVISQTELTLSKAQNLRSGLLSDLLSGEHEIPVTYDKIMGTA